jgi:hypothetical protein
VRSRFIVGIFLAALGAFSGSPASGGVISLRDLLSRGTCVNAPDPDTPGAELGTPAGCWDLKNRNSDETVGGAATGFGIVGLNDATVTGSDANMFDDLGGIFGPMLAPWGSPISTLTQFTTVIGESTPGITLGLDGITLSGELTFDWRFTTLDAGSYYDPAGYVLCPAAPSGYPSEMCGLFQLTTDLDALNEPNPLNSTSPYPESGRVTVTLAPGDVFGAYVLTPDNVGGAGTIVFSDPVAPASAPEPACFLLMGGGLLAMGWAGDRTAGRCRRVTDRRP